MLHIKNAPNKSQAIGVFIALTVVSVVLSILAGVMYRNNDVAQALLIGLGSSVFGAGLTFFLIEMTSLGQTQIRPTSALAIFIGMVVVFVVLVSIAQFVPPLDRVSQTALVSVGASVFGSGLTFFLVEWFLMQSKGSA